MCDGMRCPYEDHNGCCRAPGRFKPEDAACQEPDDESLLAEAPPYIHPNPGRGSFLPGPAPGEKA